MQPALSLAGTLSELAALAPPDGLEGALWGELKEALKEALEEAGGAGVSARESAHLPEPG